MINPIGNNHARTQDTSKLKPHAPHVQNNENRAQQNATAERKKTPKPSSAAENRVNTQNNERAARAKARVASERAYESGATTSAPVKPSHNDSTQEKRVISLIDIFA